MAGSNSSKNAAAAAEADAKALQMTLQEINQAAPGVGEALAAAFAGPLTPLALLSVALKTAYDQLTQYNAELDKKAVANANPDFLSNLQERAAVLSAAAGAAQAYADKLQQIATGEQSVSDKLKNQLELDKAVEVARATLENAQKGLELAGVQRDEASGKLNPEEAAEKRAAIEKKYIAQAQTDREAARAKESADKENQLKADEGAHKDLVQRRQGAAKALTDDLTHRAVVKANLPDLNKQAADIQGQLDIKNATLEIAQRTADQWGGTSDAANQRVAGLKNDINELNGQLAGVNRQRKEFEATQTPEAQASLQAKADAAQEATDRLDENTRQIRQLKDEVTQMKSVTSATQPLENQATDAKLQTVDANEQARILTSFENDFKVLDEFRGAKNPTAVLVERVKTAISEITTMLKDHTDLLKSLPEYDAAMADMKSDIAALKAQHASARSILNNG